ncbi:MAG: exodeoxyribonuclease VII small subunit [Saprospiraceae bacterium]|jgi:exodeoxyribonuclease VII small subunit
MAQKKNQELNYTEAYQELQQLVRELQEGKTDIDQLAGKVARANELIVFCRNRLRQTEAELDQLGQ